MKKPLAILFAVIYLLIVPPTSEAQIAPPYVKGTNVEITVRCQDLDTFKKLLEQRGMTAFAATTTDKITKTIAMNADHDVLVFDLVPAGVRKNPAPLACVLDILQNAAVAPTIPHRSPSDVPG